MVPPFTMVVGKLTPNAWIQILSIVLEHSYVSAGKENSINYEHTASVGTFIINITQKERERGEGGRQGGREKEIHKQNREREINKTDKTERIFKTN